MKGVTVLKKINKRTAQLKKKHPGKKYSTLRKQAASEYKAGKLPKAHKKKSKPKRRVSGKRKYKVTHRVKKVGAVKRRKRSAAPRRKTTTAVRYRTRTVTKFRRVGATGGKSIIPILLGVGIVLGIGYLLLRKPTVPTLPVALAPTSNPARQAAATSILQYATAAGATISALTALVNALNSMSDNEVITQAAQVSAGGGGGANPGIDVQPPGGGPGIYIAKATY